MTVVVVVSGFIGRYIYTAVPRTADGVVIEAQDLQLQLDAVRRQVAQPALGSPPAQAVARRAGDVATVAATAALPVTAPTGNGHRSAGCASSSGRWRRSAGRGERWRRGTRSTSRWAWRCS